MFEVYFHTFRGKMQNKKLLTAGQSVQRANRNNDWLGIYF